MQTITSSLNCLLIMDRLLLSFSSLLSTHSTPTPVSHSLAPNMPFGHICFIFFPFIKTIIITTRSSNLQFPLSSSLKDWPEQTFVIKGSSEAARRVTLDVALSRSAASSTAHDQESSPFVSPRPPLFFFWIRSWLFYEDPEGNGIVKSLAG